MVDALAYPLLRHLDPQLFTGPVEARQTVLCDACALAVDDGDLSVPFRGHIAYQLTHAAQVVRHHADAVIKDMVDGHHRQLGLYKLDHHRVEEIRRGDHDPVYAAVAAVLQVAGLAAADEIVDKGEIIAVFFRLAADAVEHRGKELVRKAPVHRIDKQHADIVAAVGFERPRAGIGHVAQLIRRAEDPCACLLADIRLAVERLAHRGRRDTAVLCNVFDGYHGTPLLYLIVFVALM